MKLSWGICALFYGAAAWALLVPALTEHAWRQWGLQPLKESWMNLGSGFLLAGVFSLLAMALHLDVANAWPYLLGGSLSYGLLTGFNLSSEARGVLLLTLAFALFSNFSDVSNLQLPLLASFLGLALGKLCNPNNWEGLILPGSWLVGLYWLAANISGELLEPQLSLIAIFFSVALMVRGLQALPMLAKAPTWLRPVYIGITGGLAAWLAVQNMLLQPAFLPWVGLFAGGLVLGFLLLNPVESSETNENNASHPTSLQAPGTLQSGLIALVLIGIATLVASRLFGTTGWIVLAVGLLTRRRAESYVSVSALFLLGRVLLQAFLTQYSANVTGINITHPYASAALYVGFAMMLLLPGWINAFYARVTVETQDTERQSERESNASQPGFKPTAIALLGLGPVLVAGLSNYFLHGEATASLLLALIVSGLGISLLAGFSNSQARALPLFATLLTLTGVLASPEIIDWGNQAEKSQKLVVLGVAWALILLMGLLAQRLGSGRKPVQVS
jgi:hypothetical protein